MKLDKNYTPNGFNPIHPVNDWSYVRKLARAALRGEKINPILAGNENLLAGTHRAAANDILEVMGYEKLIEVIEIDDLNEENFGAYNELISAVIDGDFEAIDQLWDRQS